jgi:hypothetical protein
MCFSATASFTASAVLGLVGTATIIKTKNKKAWPLAAVSLIFALQQFVEGLLWVSLTSRPEYTLPLTHIFLFFALLFWPVYMPIVALALEPRKIRRIILWIFCAAGAVVGFLFYASFVRQPDAAQIVNKCIFYPNHIAYPILFNYLYILATVGSGAVSSRPIIKLFCLLVLISSLVTWLVYSVNFISVWCFFAAIISAVLYFHPQKS